MADKGDKKERKGALQMRLTGKQGVDPARSRPPKVYDRLDRVLVKYTNDFKLWHLRVILEFQGYTGGGLAVYTALTPDRDVCDLELGGSETPLFVFLEGNKRPVFIKKGEVYDDNLSGAGAFDEKELVAIAKKYKGKYADGSAISASNLALAVGDSAADKDQGEKVGLLENENSGLRQQLDDQDKEVARGRERELKAFRKQREDHTPPRRTGKDEDEVDVDIDEFAWFLASPTGHLSGQQLGDEIDLPETAARFGDVAIRWHKKFPLFPEVFLRLARGEGRRLMKVMKTAFEKEFGDEGHGGDGGASRFREDHDGAGDAAGGLKRDVRILPVAYDSGSERWRNLSDAVGLMEEVDFGDWPLEGVRSMRTVLNALRRNQKSWMSSHSDWVKNSGIRMSDRAVHEHKSISKVLELLCSYDQLNAVNCAGAEAADRKSVV